MKTYLPNRILVLMATLPFIFLFALLLSLVATSKSFAANTLQIQQVLKDGINAVDGLDNPRQVKANLNSNRVFVTSGDDNSLLVLEYDGTLKPLQLFKNSEDKSKRLEGASGVITFNNGKNVAVASFYDSALSLFGEGQKSSFNFNQTFSDNLSFERIFKSKEPLTNEDNYGLFGAWDLAITADEKQIYVASFKSNAVSQFSVDEKNKVAFGYKYTPTDSLSLGGPTSLVISNIRNEIITAGYENNTLSVLSIGENGTLSPKQKIINGVDGVEGLVNPQKVLLSPNEKYLYVACSGSNAILVFESKNNRYSFVQSITHSDTNAKGLKGVASMALTKDGSQLFAAGEMDDGLLLFDVLSNGKLTFNGVFQSHKNRIEGVTSIAIMNDDKNLLLTLGKKDALYLLSIGNKDANQEN